MWSIASSDSCSGAGIQADLKTATQLNVHCNTIIVALTAQNSTEVSAVEPASLTSVAEQIRSLKKEHIPKVVKLGLLPTSQLIELVARELEGMDSFVICDPVFVASSGSSMVASDCLESYRRHLFRHIDLLTPNIPELARLTGHDIVSESDMLAGARHLLETTEIRALVVKGGHLAGNFSHDLYIDKHRKIWITGMRLEGSAHGTGCTFASAISASLAKGLGLLDSIVIAKAYVAQGLIDRYQIGDGDFIINQPTWPVSPAAYPWINKDHDSATELLFFPDTGPRPLGFYPIVDRARWVKRLVAEGVKTVQLRIKDLSGDDLDREIKEAVRIAMSADCRIFINDYWKIAIKHGAYGIHLGQEDLEDLSIDDLRTIAKAGLRLGLSTHSYEEAARAHALRPSYIALGPIFETSCKSMAFGPQGIAKASQWRQLFNYPIVAIGGLKLEHASALTQCGIQSIAVITDIVKADDPEAQTKKWLAAFS